MTTSLQETEIMNKLYQGLTLTNEEGLFLLNLLIHTRTISKTLISHG